MVEVDPERFEEMVGAALDGPPAQFRRQISNVAVTVEHGRGPRGGLGLYEDIPATSRTTQYAGALPDRITIYQQAICAISPDPRQRSAGPSSTRSGTTSASTTPGWPNWAGNAATTPTGLDLAWA